MYSNKQTIFIFKSSHLSCILFCCCLGIGRDVGIQGSSWKLCQAALFLCKSRTYTPDGNCGC